MYYSFEFDMPTRVLFGEGKLNELHDEKLPGTKALIVTTNGTSVKKYGYLDRLQKELDLAGIPYELFPEIRPNPTRENVMDGAAKAKETGCDFVVALGGGSVMDCSKCIALMMTNDGDLWDYAHCGAGGKQTPEKKAAPLVCITTSAGTASEVDCGGVISNDATNEKTAIVYPTLQPVLSVVDSELMMSVPPKFTAYQGMDAFFHASETVINRFCHPMAEMFALKTIEYVAKYLPRAVADGSDREARAYMALANSFAGYYMMCNSEHTMEHTMGSFHPDLPHGAGLIMISHAYYDFFAQREACEEQMLKMARAMGCYHQKSGKAFVEALDRLIADVGCADLKMSDYGITEEELELYPAKCRTVDGGIPDSDPLILSNEDMLSIWKASWK